MAPGNWTMESGKSGSILENCVDAWESERLVIHLQHRQKGFLRNVDLADALHALLSLLSAFSSSLRLREMSPP